MSEIDSDEKRENPSLSQVKVRAEIRDYGLNRNTSMWTRQYGAFPESSKRRLNSLEHETDMFLFHGFETGGQ